MHDLHLLTEELMPRLRGDEVRPQGGVENLHHLLGAWIKYGGRARHKLATSPKSLPRRMADSCGLRRTGLLWQKRPQGAVLFP